MYCLSLDDNLIDNWKSIDQLNEYHQIKRLRFANNPLLSITEGGEIAAWAMIIAKMKYLDKYWGGDIPKSEKKDCELFYMKTSYLEFTKVIGKVTSLEDEKLSQYMQEHHPWWYELVEMYGNPIEELNSDKQKGKDIKANSISITI